MNAEAIRGRTQEASVEAEEAEAARRHEGSGADAESVSEMRRSEDPASSLSELRDVP
jgi:hypothetical protein